MEEHLLLKYSPKVGALVIYFVAYSLGYNWVIAIALAVAGVHLSAFITAMISKLTKAVKNLRG